jgi:hypothetical protein
MIYLIDTARSVISSRDTRNRFPGSGPYQLLIFQCRASPVWKWNTGYNSIPSEAVSYGRVYYGKAELSMN